MFFVLHNFCEINKEVIKPSYVVAIKKFDLGLQPATFTGYTVNNNELHGKNVYVRKQPLIGVLYERCSCRLIELEIEVFLYYLTSLVKLLQLAKWRVLLVQQYTE